MTLGDGWIRRPLVAAAVIAAALIGGAASAQSPAPGDRDALLARCESQAATAVQHATCAWVVDTVLAPAPTPSTPPFGTGLPGVGVKLERPTERVTVLEVDWDAAAMIGHAPKDNSKRLVGVRVAVEALTDGDAHDPAAWWLVGSDGTAWRRSSVTRRPSLSTGDALPAGATTRGWLIFEAPKSIHRFEVVESGTGALRWSVVEVPCMWIRPYPGHAKERLCPPATDTTGGSDDVTDVPMPQPGASAGPAGPPGSLATKATPAPSVSPAPSTGPASP